MEWLSHCLICFFGKVSGGAGWLIPRSCSEDSLQLPHKLSPSFSNFLCGYRSVSLLTAAATFVVVVVSSLSPFLPFPLSVCNLWRRNRTFCQKGEFKTWKNKKDLNLERSQKEMVMMNRSLFEFFFGFWSQSAGQLFLFHDPFQGLKWKGFLGNLFCLCAFFSQVWETVFLQLFWYGKIKILFALWGNAVDNFLCKTIWWYNPKRTNF